MRFAFPVHAERNHTAVPSLSFLQSRLSVRSLRHACLLASLLLLCLRHVQLLLPDRTQCSAALYAGCSTHPQGLTLMKRAEVHFRKSHVAGTRSAPAHSFFPIWLIITAAAAHEVKRASARARADRLCVHPRRAHSVPRRRRVRRRGTRASELSGHRGEEGGGPGWDLRAENPGGRGVRGNAEGFKSPSERAEGDRS